jgi:hypothetical protein
MCVGLRFANSFRRKCSKGQVSDLTLRAVIIAAVLSVISVFWMHQASLVQAPGIIYAPVYLLSVPPVPAIFSLMLLVALVPLTKRLFTKALGKRELIFVYIVLCIVIPPVTFGIVELLLPWTTAGAYLSLPDNNHRALCETLPQWFYPHDEEVVRTMYEGSDDGTVPWRPWLYPLAMWTVWMTLVFGTFLCLMALFHRQWVEHERLRYPLLFIPLSVVEKEVPGSHAPFFRSTLVWLGIGIVIVHHIFNIANAYNPAVMALTDRYNLGRAIFSEYPWTAFRGLTVFHRPQVIGLGYFVPVDILFSGWFFFVFQSVLVFLSNIFGLTATPGFPFPMSQSGGGYLAMMFVLFWMGRHQLGHIARKALYGDASIDDSAEPLPYRWAFFGAIGGFVALVTWSRFIGLPLGHSIAYFLVFISSGFVFARIRAEAGVATMWGPAPRYIEPILEFTGTRGLIAGGNLAPLAVLRVYNWVSRGFLGSMSAYHAENFHLADEVKIGSRKVSVVMMVAFVVGCILAYYFVLGAYYRYGATVLHGGTTMGGYNVLCAMRSWHAASAAVDTPSDPHPQRIIAALSGAALVIAMLVARWRWLRVPFHPIGYVSCIWYGYALWFPFMATWAIKLLIHRLGGARLYRQLMPFFLGLAFGDLLAGGISWIIMAIFGPDIFAGYMVQFG